MGLRYSGSGVGLVEVLTVMQSRRFAVQEAFLSSKYCIVSVVSIFCSLATKAPKMPMPTALVLAFFESEPHNNKYFKLLAQSQKQPKQQELLRVSLISNLFAGSVGSKVY